MPSTGFLLPTARTVDAGSGTWTNDVNILADDGSEATFSLTSKNTTGRSLRGQTFNFDSAIPAGATINQVQIRMEYRVNNTGGVANPEMQAFVSGTGVGAVRTASPLEPTTLTLNTFDITADRSWTRSDLLNGTFEVRCWGRNGNSTTDPSYRWDYLAAEVVYTESGTQHTVDRDDSTGLTDATALIISLERTDATGLTDTSVASPPDAWAWNNAVAWDNAEAWPTDPGGGTEHTVDRSDSTGLVDVAAVTVTLVRDDTTGLTDASTVELVKLVEQTDTAGLTDASALTVGLGATDTTGLADVAQVTVGVERSDTIGLTDAFSTTVGKIVDQTDTAGLTDTVALTRSLVVTDSAGLTDAGVNVTYTETATDSTGLTDTRVIEIGKILTRDDLAGLTDTAALSRTNVHADVAGLTDAAALAVSLTRTDTTGLTDAASAGLLKAVEHTDGAGLTDTRAIASAANVVDLAGLSDVVSFQLGLVVADNTGLTDEGAPFLGLFFTQGEVHSRHRVVSTTLARSRTSAGVHARHRETSTVGGG